MNAVDSDEGVLEAHRLLVKRGAIEPLASTDDEVQRWLDWELASLVEGHFHQILDPTSLASADRVDREHGYEVRTPRIPELDYDIE